MKVAARTWAPGVAAIWLAAACTGSIDGAPTGGAAPGGASPASGPGTAGAPAGPTPGGPATAPPTAPPPQTAPGAATIGHLPVAQASTAVRRLSTQELGNALEALLGFRPEALSRLPADSQTAIFDRVRESQTVSEQHTRGFEALADDVATRLLGGALGTLVPACGADRRAWGRPCADAFLTALLDRAYRRPTTPDEKAAALRLFDAGSGFDEGFRLLVHRVFRSPFFLYLVEGGAPGDVAGRTRPLSDHELAARLSFSLCETLPDPALLADARAGTLASSPEKVAAHARRLLAAPCGRVTLRRFFAQWLRLDEVTHLSRNKTLFPTFDAAVAASMRAETERFVEHLIFDAGGTVANLIDARFSILDDRTAALYGVGKVGAQPARRDLPPERRGLLTHPGLLAVASDDDATSPVLRGVFVLGRVLCGEMPPPPPDLEIAVPDLDSSKTTRERWERHSSDPVCSACHQFIDPVGFALENFDAVGRHRTTENGKPIDASGGIPMFGVAAGSVTGGAALSTAVASLPQLRDCVARRWTRFALGRLEAETDRSSLETLSTLAAGGAPIADVLAGLGTTASFRHRDPGARNGK